MYKKKSFFITFEGVEGSGKSYQSKKLFNYLKKKKYDVIFTREPGGSTGAEKIRKILLTGNKDKFTKTTDTLLYLAARNEHIEKLIRPSIKRKKIIICDRFIDSTLAYQVYGSNVNKKLVDHVHKLILSKIKPDLTIVLKVNLKKAAQRVQLRKFKNRYDKLSYKFYDKAQKSFIKIAKKNKKKYKIFDNSTNTTDLEKKILNLILKRIK